MNQAIALVRIDANAREMFGVKKEFLAGPATLIPGRTPCLTGTDIAMYEPHTIVQFTDITTGIGVSADVAVVEWPINIAEVVFEGA